MKCNLSVSGRTDLVNETRICATCGKKKPFVDFYKDIRANPPVMGTCKECHRVACRLRERGRSSEYNREAYWGNATKKGKREGILRYHRKHAKRINTQTTAWNRQDYQKHPEKYRAHKRVNCAIRSGKILRPPRCEECGVGGQIQGHHHDYSKPLDVRWLCFLCHKRAHWKHPTGKPRI